jgi:ABC-type lipoprotein export system ATPase subunit
MSDVVLSVRSIEKTHLRRGAPPVRVLSGVSFDVRRGELVTVTGASGSGKTTLLSILGALDRPTSGSVCFEGVELASLPDAALSAFRRRRLGFVFQAFHLLPHVTVLDNVLLPLVLDGRATRQGHEAARALLHQLGLAHRIDHRACELSGGEMQRVAIARALVADPVCVLADEPTGNLDSRAADDVLALLREAVCDRQVACVLVTHDARAAEWGTRTIVLSDGRIARDGAPPARSSGPRMTELVRDVA